MSRTKAYLFDRLPQDEGRKVDAAKAWSERSKAFGVRIPTRRKNPGGGPRWDPLWASCLHKAAKDLGIETMQINDGLHLKDVADRDAVFALAEVLLRKRRASILARSDQV